MEPGFLWRSVTGLAYRSPGAAFFSGAQQNMTESMQSSGAPAETKPTFWQKASKWVYAIVGLVGVGIGALLVQVSVVGSYASTTDVATPE